MTRLNRPVRRETFSPKWGDLIVTMTPEGCVVRLKGTRTNYGPVPWGVIMQRGAEMKAAELRATRAANRKKKLRRL
jgi:hypothetical protein